MPRAGFTTEVSVFHAFIKVRPTGCVRKKGRNVQNRRYKNVRNSKKISNKIEENIKVPRKPDFFSHRSHEINCT